VPPAAHRERAAKILDILDETYPEADTELKHRNAFELVVATILSAQCTDERVNQVTPALLRPLSDGAGDGEGAPRPGRSDHPVDRLLPREDQEHPRLRRALVEHGGVVPRTMEAMVKLPGVGRKTKAAS
jgi:endonuclease-3